MRVAAALAGITATGGLLVAWRAPRGFAPLFLVAGLAVTAVAVVLGLGRDGRTGVFVAMLAVPYWGSWLLVWALSGVGKAGGSVR